MKYVDSRNVEVGAGTGKISGLPTWMYGKEACDKCTQGQTSFLEDEEEERLLDEGSISGDITFLAFEEEGYGDFYNDEDNCLKSRYQEANPDEERYQKPVSVLDMLAKIIGSEIPDMLDIEEEDTPYRDANNIPVHVGIGNINRLPTWMYYRIKSEKEALNLIEDEIEEVEIKRGEMAGEIIPLAFEIEE